MVFDLRRFFLLSLIFISANLFSQTDSIPSDTSNYIIRSISFTGNKQTKDFIMLRELVFHTGDTVSGAEFKRQSQRSQENLLNTALFNFVTISPSCLPDSI